MMSRPKKANLKDFWKTRDSKCVHWRFAFLSRSESQVDTVGLK